MHGILEKVRSRILDWALDLEGRGIIGEGMSFTPQEKQAAQEQHYHFGNVSGSQIQISSNGSTQTQANTTGTDLEALRGLVEALGAALDRGTVQGDAADELRAELATLKAQAASPKPKWEIIKATARTIKTVAEGAAGNILGNWRSRTFKRCWPLLLGAEGPFQHTAHALDCKGLPPESTVFRMVERQSTKEKTQVKSMTWVQFWRRGRDSNPRWGLTHTRFPGVRLKPLIHLSGKTCILA